ncbi:MAG: hypothetical protein HY049_20095 [Acidobacteria bacterium]|nr:hypothetical protein [Acidobacteriota bacterium]
MSSTRISQNGKWISSTLVAARQPRDAARAQRLLGERRRQHPQDGVPAPRRPRGPLGRGLERLEIGRREEGGLEPLLADGRREEREGLVPLGGRPLEANEREEVAVPLDASRAKDRAASQVVAETVGRHRHRDDGGGRAVLQDHRAELVKGLVARAAAHRPREGADLPGAGGAARGLDGRLRHLRRGVSILVSSGLPRGEPV